MLTGNVMVARPSMRRALLGAAVFIAILAGRWLDVPHRIGGIKGDEATYIAMTLSLAHDGDLRWQPEDYARFAALYPQGPSGIFLKKRYTIGLHGKTPVSTDQSLAFGKAFIYPLVAAPFVLVGGLGAMAVLNWLMLGLCLACALRFCRARVGGWPGRLLAVVFFVASVTPVYAAWLTPEMFNVTLATVAYFLWLYKRVAPPEDRRLWTRPWTTAAAALLIGVATYSKPTHAALVIPMVIDALFAGHAWRRRSSAAAGAVAAVVLAFTVGCAALFALNAFVSGEMNYQGSADRSGRRSFYDHYPFDREGTPFDAHGNAMVTNDADTSRVLASDMLAGLPTNAWYFVVGRDSGLMPYFAPGALLLALCLVLPGGRPAWQWGIVVAIVGSIGAFLVLFPDCWNGCGGPPGNRYFLSLYPALLFLAPATGALWPAVGGLLVGGAFTWAMVVHPYAASTRTWLNVERAPLRWLPIELSLINDLPVVLFRPRGPVEFIKEPTVFFYYFDSNTYYAEGDGLWIAGKASTDIVVRTERPIKRIKIEFSSSIDNHVTGNFAGKPIEATVGPDQIQSVVLTVPRFFKYHQSYAYVLHLSTTAGFVPAQDDPGSHDTRNLGVFLRPSFVY
jgi:hypothetical protein